MEIVYIETTIVSLLVSNPSRDIVVAAQQKATRHWWDTRRPLFQCIISDETRAEAERGDSTQVELRRRALADLPVFAVSEEVENLSADFLKTGALPAFARSDSVHLAAATLAKADYLLTWNCRHLANAQIVRRLEREAARLGWQLPTVCTPLELMGH
jgi:hypothetical protein